MITTGPYRALAAALPSQFGERVLPFDVASARIALTTQSQRRVRPCMLWLGCCSQQPRDSVDHSVLTRADS